MIDATRLLGSLVERALPSAASQVIRYAGRRSQVSSLLNGGSVAGGALGLTGGLALAAYDHYNSQSQAKRGYALDQSDDQALPKPTVPLMATRCSVLW